MSFLGTFSSSAPMLAGRFHRTQWTQVPAGASGSSAIRAKLFVPATAPDQERGGETSCPSQVYLAGIGPPWGNAWLLISMRTPPATRSARRGTTSATDRIIASRLDYRRAGAQADLGGRLRGGDGLRRSGGRRLPAAELRHHRPAARHRPLRPEDRGHRAGARGGHARDDPGRRPGGRALAPGPARLRLRRLRNVGHRLLRLAAPHGRLAGFAAGVGPPVPDPAAVVATGPLPCSRRP